MKRYLFTVSVGPVQEFIRAARRTRDLWAGSALLSAISRAAALEMAKHGPLIFPGANPESVDAAVANVILGEVTTDSPAKVAAAVKKVAEDEWRKRAERARAEIEVTEPGLLETERFKGQLDGVIEFFAAWVRYEEESDYRAARRRVTELLAGRKNCRDFEQATFAQMQVPKSSLDGNRETVWAAKKPTEAKEPENKRLRRDLRFSPGEQLDAIGVTKRMSEVIYYPSITRIAAEPWLSGLPAADRERLSELCQKLQPFGKPPKQWEHLAPFGFDGSMAYPERHRALRDELEDSGKEEALDEIGRLLKKWSGGTNGRPQAYYAVLQADGDRMGRLISTIPTAEKHRSFSRTMAGFARDVKQIVEEDHQGCLIFAGGDDVLAILPLHTALDAAGQIRALFGRTVGEENASATLRVGLAIGHFLEPMEDTLDAARKAEKDAKKKGGNSLRVVLQPRSGVEIGVTYSWNEDPVKTLSKYVGWHVEGMIGDKAAYDLERMLPLYDYDDVPVEAMRKDALRALRRKRAINPEQKAAIEELETVVRESVESFADLKRLVNALLISRRIAEAQKQAAGRRG